ncbi:hypothetical protein [Streptosporangium sp. NPDC049644]|uniref:hypothetical protein n=1 Tax=Streptosporangium sp. NPDC049644 TaxID=3155507 RepID=UPI003445DEFE
METLHQLRHSALTHAAEDGANTPTLLASPARCARISPEAPARWQEGRDPAARRRGRSRGDGRAAPVT